MKKIIFALITTTALLLSSCTMMLQSTIKDTPISNKIMLHDNVRVGDYAVYKSKINTEDEQSKKMIGETTVTVQVTERKRNNITIKQTVTTTGGVAAIFGGTMEYELVSDDDGNIKSGYFYQGPEKIPLKIAKPGDKAYNTFGKLNKTDNKKWNIPGEITVPAGTFKVDAMYYQDKDMQEGAKAIYLGTKKVNFYHVATMVVEEQPDGTKLKTIMELVEQGRK